MMVDWTAVVTQITDTIATLKAATGLVKDIAPLVQNTEAKEKLNAVRDQLLTATERVNDLRAVNNEIVDRNLELEGELRQIKAFLSKREGYVPHKLERGAFVYVAEKDAANAEDAPWYCQHCFEVEHRVSPINYQREAPRRLAIYGCKSCGTTIEDYPR